MIPGILWFSFSLFMTGLLVQPLKMLINPNRAGIFQVYIPKTGEIRDSVVLMMLEITERLTLLMRTAFIPESRWSKANQLLFLRLF